MARPELEDGVVLRYVADALIPYVLIFGFYVIAHGEIGPGGGFQGGVILAAAYVLYCLIHGRLAGQRILPPHWVERVMALGVLLFVSVGCLGMVFGNAFLDYRALSALLGLDMESGEPLGMTIIETGIGFTVAAVMITVFNMITEEED